MKAWMLVIGNLEMVNSEMAEGIAHATFGKHPSNPTAPVDEALFKVFGPLIFHEKPDWVQVKEDTKQMGFLFKVKPPEAILVKLGKLFIDIFPGCLIEFQKGEYNEV